MKIIQLTAPVDDAELGLIKGEAYYVATHVEGVTGLKAFVQALIPQPPNSPVTSVNGLTGQVVLTAINVGALDKQGKAITSFKADQAVKLSQSVMINGVPFDGTQNITIVDPNVATLSKQVKEHEARIIKLENKIK